MLVTIEGPDAKEVWEAIMKELRENGDPIPVHSINDERTYNKVMYSEGSLGSACGPLISKVGKLFSWSVSFIPCAETIRPEEDQLSLQLATAGN